MVMDGGMDIRCNKWDVRPQAKNSEESLTTIVFHIFWLHKYLLRNTVCMLSHTHTAVSVNIEYVKVKWHGRTNIIGKNKQEFGEKVHFIFSLSLSLSK